MKLIWDYVISAEPVGAGHEPGQGAAGGEKMEWKCSIYDVSRKWIVDEWWRWSCSQQCQSVFADAALMLLCAWSSPAPRLWRARLTRGLWTFSLATDLLLVSSNHLTHRDCGRHATWLQEAWANTDRIMGYWTRCNLELNWPADKLQTGFLFGFQHLYEANGKHRMRKGEVGGGFGHYIPAVMLIQSLLRWWENSKYFKRSSEIRKFKQLTADVCMSLI